MNLCVFFKKLMCFDDQLVIETSMCWYIAAGLPVEALNCRYHLA